MKGTAVGPGGGKIAFEPQNPKTTLLEFFKLFAHWSDCMDRMKP